MQNLLLFFWRNHFTLLFVGLEVIAFSLLISTNSFHQTKVHQWSIAMAGQLYDIQFACTQYLGLSSENEELRLTNAGLLESKIQNQPKNQSTHSGFQVIPTVAINSTYHFDNNYIIINTGSADGVEPATAVVGPKGAVGIVHSVSSNFASIIPLIHSNSDISARLKSNSYFGQCTWRGFDESIITLENIPNHVEIKPGDTVVTRGSGGVFPSGIIIGFALESEKNQSSGFQEISVELATDFKNVHSLYVIKNQLKPELDSIITQTQEWIGK